MTYYEAGEEDDDFHFGETPQELLDRLAREKEERDRAAAASDDDDEGSAEAPVGEA